MFVSKATREVVLLSNLINFSFKRICSKNKRRQLNSKTKQSDARISELQV